MKENLLWVDKYKPLIINDIIGNKLIVKNIVKWLKTWKNNSKKALLLSGPPGIGKTSMANIICNELKYSIESFDASLDRTKSILEKKFKSINCNTLFKYSNDENQIKNNKVIIMDEIDSMSSSDKGGMTTLINTIKISKIPIICICNDRYNQSLKPLINYVIDIKVQKPDLKDIIKKINFIVENEKININKKTLEKLIINCNNDIRNTINNLQFISNKKRINNKNFRVKEIKKINNLSKDNIINLSLFESARLMLIKELDLNIKSDLYFNDYNLIPLFIQENYIQNFNNSHRKKYKKIDFLNNISDLSQNLSNFDLMDNVYNNGNKDWGLLPINACYVSLIGNKIDSQNNVITNFPNYYGKHSTKTKRKNYLNDLTSSINQKYNNNYRLDYLPFIQTILNKPLFENIPDKKTQKIVVINYVNRLINNNINKEFISEKIPDFNLGEYCQSYNYKKINSKIKNNITRELNKIF